MVDKIWYKRALIPLWVVQILVSLVYIASAGLALWVTNDDDVSFSGEIESALNTGAAINLSFGIFTVLIDIVEMILMCMGKLSPITNIVFQSIKSTIWLFFLIITIRAAVLGVSSGLIIFLTIAIFLTCLGQLIYGSVIMHRHRKGTLYRGNYAPADGAFYTQNQSQFGETMGISAPQPNPFRDPSQTSFSQPPHGGAATDYYAPHHVQQSYEMHSSNRY